MSHCRESTLDVSKISAEAPSWWPLVCQCTSGWAKFTKLSTCLSALLMTERCPSMQPGLSATPTLLQPLFRLVIIPRNSLTACTGLNPLKDSPVSHQQQVTLTQPASFLNATDQMKLLLLFKSRTAHANFILHNKTHWTTESISQLAQPYYITAWFDITSFHLFTDYIVRKRSTSSWTILGWGDCSSKKHLDQGHVKIEVSQAALHLSWQMFQLLQK